MILPESVLKMIPILDKYEVGSMDPVVTHGWLVAMAQELIEYRERIRPACHYCGTVFRLDQLVDGVMPRHNRLPPLSRAGCPESGQRIRTLHYRHPSEVAE